MRPRRVLAVAWRDLRLVHAGSRWYRLPLLALGLLLPAGGLPLELERPAPEPSAAVAGEIPAGLEGRLVADPQARVALSGSEPVVLRGGSVPAPVREALDRLPGPRVFPVTVERDRPLPGRSLLVALLAISLLTGPLSESLPGERSGRTLEVLLSAAIRRGELIAGKWLAWTAYGGALALLAALGGLWSGVVEPGLWPLALPLVVGSATALGLWLVRGAADEVSGAGVPMRVLPMVAVVSAGAAWALAGTHPLLGAALPLGGALLVASGALVGPGALVAALLGSGLAIAGMLWATARALDGDGARRVDRWRALGPALLAPWLHWMAVAGGGLWALAGNPNLVLPPSAPTAAAGVLIGLLGLVLIARDGALRVRMTTRWGLVPGLVVGAGLGGVLVLMNDYVPQLLGPETLAPLRARLLASPVEAGPVALLCWVMGQAVFFRAALPARLGQVGAAVLYALVVYPFEPVQGLVLGGALGVVAARWGLLPAVLAHVVALLVEVAGG